MNVYAAVTAAGRIQELKDRVAELEAQRDRAWERVDEFANKVARVETLVDKWDTMDLSRDEYSSGRAAGKEQCADELRDALGSQP